MKKLFLFILSSLFLSCASYAFTLSGTITDSTGKALPYVSVMVKGTTNGCITNEKGYYTLPLDAGDYEVVYSYIGYEQQIIKVKISDRNLVQNVVMPKLVLMLKVFTLNAGDEDPAYRIIREAQKKRKDYLEQLKSFSCEVYIKDLERLKEFPKKLMGFKREDILGDEALGLDSNGRGILYLSESVSNYNFMYPDKQKEEMISSKVSGDKSGFSYNQVSDRLYNFYENTSTLGGMSERGFVSPIAAGAMMYYRYKLEGSFMENSLLVNKIQVIPRRKNDPVYRGYIYIVEDLWNIHSLDLMLTKDAQIDFLDTFNIQQIHSKTENDVWVPTYYKYSYDFSYMGIKGQGYNVAVQSNYVLNPEFPKGFFGPEVMKVNEDANKKDSVYWEKTRPISLTEEEIKDYHRKDSLTKIRESKTYKDSVDKRANRFKPGAFILSGYSFSNREKKTHYSFNLGIFGLGYNTVEGFNLNPSFYYRKELEKNKSYSAGSGFRYNFGNKRVNPELWASYYFKPVHFSSVSFWAGQSSVQYNQDDIIPLINTVYTIFWNRNYMKIYERKYIAASYYSEIKNGIYFYGVAFYNIRSPLLNTQNWLVKDIPGVKFTSNNPQFPDSSGYAFEKNNALFLDMKFDFHIKQRYYTRPNEKFVLGSKYPVFNLEYKKGLGDVDFDLVKGGVSKEINMKMFGAFSFIVNGGTFLNKKKLYFMDYQHFYGNQTIFTMPARSNSHNGNGRQMLAGFQLLPYYKYSTVSPFVEAHAEHHFNGWIINKFPLLRKTRFQEVAGIHCLSTKEIKQYVELSVGIEKIGIPGVIPGFLRVDFITAFNAKTKITNGFRIGIGI